jgi:hypothetical protein
MRTAAMVGLLAATAVAAFVQVRVADSHRREADRVLIGELSERLERRLERIEGRLAALAAQTPPVTAGSAAVAALPCAHGPTTAAAPADEPAPKAPPSPEVQAAITKATGVVDRALASGHWTQGDTLALRSSMGTLDTEDRMVLLRRLNVATNTDRLKIENDDAPW